MSVYSLLASRIGALATDFTATESSSLSSEVNAQGGVSTPVAKAELSSGIKAEQTSGTQVMRKSTVQSTFRELHGYIRDALVMRVEELGETPKISGVQELRKLSSRADGWVIDAATMSRGHVLEVEVALNADDTFRASTIMSTLVGFIRELPQLPDTVDREGFKNAVTGMRLLDGLLAGVVPVRGRVLEYVCIDVDGSDYLVHRRLLNSLGDEVAVRPIEVVGICEFDLFWRDLRRVLFSSSHYRVLCRLGADGPQRDWTPVKLIDVLEGVVPGLRGIVDAIPSMLAKAGEQNPEGAPAERMRSALVAHANDLCGHHGHVLTEAMLAERALPTAEQCASHEDFKARRRAFSDLSQRLASEFQFQLDPVDVARYRTQALIDVGLLEVGGAFEDADPGSLPTMRDARYLECEIVAIYW